MHKQLNCQYIPVEKLNASTGSLLTDYPPEALDNLLWSSTNYSPQVVFSMAYTRQSILLNYLVKEKYAIARHTHVNDLVYKDSCVEFFVSFNNGASYYNLEFNCIGTPYGAFGQGKTNRAQLPADVVKQIEIDVKQNGVDDHGITTWEIALQIPFTVFVFDDITSLNGTECKANFYKCGDETPEPHYLSWNNILSSEPNFHLPQFFGTVKFI